MIYAILVSLLDKDSSEFYVFVTKIPFLVGRVAFLNINRVQRVLNSNSELVVLLELDSDQTLLEPSSE